MSELTKIAAIFAKHLSDALLSVHHELAKLDRHPTPSPLSQAIENPKNVSIERPELKQRHTYDPRDKVMVKSNGSEFPNRCVILKRLSDTEYLVYYRRQAKSTAFKVSYEQILGLDPDR